MGKFLSTTALMGVLGGCTGVPVVTAPGEQPPALYTVMQPLCLVACSNPVSTIREDLTSTGGAPVTTGSSKTVTQTSNAGGLQ